MDKRWHELAHILVTYSAQVRPGERVMIAMGEATTLPLVRAVYEAAIKAGAHVQVQFLSEYLRHSLLRHGTAEQVAWVPEIEAYGMEWADIYFGLRGAHNLYELTDIPAQVLAAHQRALGQISALRWQKTRWCLVRVPNEALAQQAQTDVETLTDTFFAACLRDWSAEAARWQRIAAEMEKGSEVRLTGWKTDLRFSVRGRRWLVGDGHMNMPDGEILTAPVVESLDGYIAFEFPAVLSGRLVPGVRLEWRGGRLVRAEARENGEFLRQVLATDAGAGLIGEFAVGVNDGLDRFCYDILLDEKIGGTVHIALGRAYPETGGTNASAIHWDMVKDTRREGTIYLDGQAVFRDGRFTI
ncbi:MAG: aminopeptidase [Anaerolineae bacterium]